LATSDLCLLGDIKISLAGRVFNYFNKPLEVIIEFLNEAQPSDLKFVVTTGSNERNGSWSTIETTITSEQQILISRDELFSGWPHPPFMNHPIICAAFALPQVLSSAATVDRSELFRGVPDFLTFLIQLGILFYSAAFATMASIKSLSLSDSSHTLLCFTARV
jgi:hypothetical protein